MMLNHILKVMTRLLTIHISGAVIYPADSYD